MAFDRITVNPAVCSGKPCIRGLRFPVSRLLGLLASGETREAILGAYPYLEAEDVDQALGYPAYLADEETLEVVPLDRTWRCAMLKFDRITFDPNVMAGRACIRGMRITVSLVVNLVANAMSTDDILEAYPDLQAEDIQQALQYAAWLAEDSIHSLEPAVT